MEFCPKFIISPSGELHELELVTNDDGLTKHQYTSVPNTPRFLQHHTSAPGLTSQWLVNHRYAITEDNDLYDLKTHQTIEKINSYVYNNNQLIKDRNHSISKIKRVIVSNQSSIMDIVHGHRLGMFIIDMNDNVYHCGYDMGIGFFIHSTRIAEDVIHCSVTDRDLIVYSRSSGWFTRSTCSRNPRNLPDPNILPPIEDLLNLRENYLLYQSQQIRIRQKTVVNVDELIGMMDVMSVHGLSDKQKIAINGDGLLYCYDYKQSRWEVIPNQDCKWIKLLLLENGVIGALNSNGQLYAIKKNEVLEDLDIPIDLLISRRSKNGRNVAKIVDE